MQTAVIRSGTSGQMHPQRGSRSLAFLYVPFLSVAFVHKCLAISCLKACHKNVSIPKPGGIKNKIYYPSVPTLPVPTLQDDSLVGTEKQRTL